MKKNRLSKAQQRIVNTLHSYTGSFIQATIIKHSSKWYYVFAKPAGGFYVTFENGVLRRRDNLYDMMSLPYHKVQETIRCLIHKKVLITTMTDKEFAIQYALGTIDHRIYELAEEYR